MPGSFFSNLEIDNAAKIASVNAPLLWIHGLEDDFLQPMTHGKSVFDQHPGPKKSILVDGASHADIPFILGYENYLENILTFVVEKP